MVIALCKKVFLFSLDLVTVILTNKFKYTNGHLAIYGFLKNCTNSLRRSGYNQTNYVCSYVANRQSLQASSHLELIKNP